MVVKSLAARLSISIILVQLLSIIVAFAVFPLLAPFTSYGIIAERTARSLVIDSVDRRPAVHAILAQPQLTSYRSTRPSLRYAAADSSGILAGSDPELAKILTRVAPQMRMPDSKMQIPSRGGRDDVTLLTSERIGTGTTIIATAGNRFGVEDMASFWEAFLPAILPGYGPIFLAALLVVPLVVAHFLRPLRQAAERARRLDIVSGDHLLPLPGLPFEFEPLCAAIDTALVRSRENMIGQRLFFANAAHELRTPIAVLHAQTELFASDPSERHRLLSQVRTLGLLVDRLLSVTRLEHRAEPFAPIDLSDLARDAARDCAPMTLARRVMIACDVPDAPVMILGDRAAIIGAVAAILDNASKSEPSGGEIIIDVSRDAILTVVDHGAGFTGEEIALAFEAFWRRTNDQTGFGLGLATVRRVAELHGGTANIVSVPDRETRVSLSFVPIANGQADAR